MYRTTPCTTTLQRPCFCLRSHQRGRTDVFNVDLLPLGDIHQLRIGHDAKGNNPRWHLDRVIVKNKTDTAQPTLVFPCGAAWVMYKLGWQACGT